MKTRRILVATNLTDQRAVAFDRGAVERGAYRQVA